MREPSPFIHYDEASKKFLDGANPAWKQACMKKFDWIRRLVEQDIKEQTPISLALTADKKDLEGHSGQCLTT